MRDQAVRDDLDIPLSADTPSYWRPRPQSSLDANTKHLLMIAGGIGGLLLLVVGGYSLTGHRHTGIPVVEAQAGPIRVKPEHPGGLQVLTGLDDGIGSDDESKAAVAPAPEAPDIKALHAEELRAKLDQQQMAASAPASQAASTTVDLGLTSGAAQPSLPAVSIKQAGPTPDQTSAAVAAPHAMAPASPSESAPSVSAPPVSGTQVQLAALATQEAAMAEWSRLAHKLPALFTDRRPVVTRYDHEGKTFWRLRTSGFADTAQATSFCHQLREKGANCSLATF